MSFTIPLGIRRAIFGSLSFYESIFSRCGMALPNPFSTEGLYFSEEETNGLKVGGSGMRGSSL
jgi:hypothetical protein